MALPHVLKLIDTLVMSPEEALIEATATHQVDWVQEWLQRFKCDLDVAMLQAATKGYRDIVKLLLEHMDSGGTEEEELKEDDDMQVCVEAAIMAAAEHGHCGVVRSLMPVVMEFYRSFSFWAYYATARRVLNAAAVNGHLDVVVFLVQHAHMYGYAQRCFVVTSQDTLVHAVSHGEIQVAEFLIERSGMPWCLKHAFVIAVEKGLTTIAEKIFDVYPQRIRRSNLFVELAGSGKLNAVKYLYNNRCNEAGLVGKALASAASRGNADVVKFLLDTGRISSHAFDKAFKHACFGFRTVDLAKFLYNLKRATPEGINRAFAVANDVAILKLLDENENISDGSVVTVFSKWIEPHNVHDRQIEALKFLINKACIPSKLMDKALVAAAKDGDSKLVDLIRGDSRLSSAAMGEAFVIAAASGKRKLMESLYDEERTPPEALVQAFSEAAHRKRTEIVKTVVKLLSVEKYVPREFRYKTLVAAARHGQMQILEIVCDSKTEDWPLEVLKQAIDVAEGNDKIVNLLRKMVCDRVFSELITS